MFSGIPINMYGMEGWLIFGPKPTLYYIIVRNKCMIELNMWTSFWVEMIMHYALYGEVLFFHNSRGLEGKLLSWKK